MPETTHLTSFASLLVSTLLRLALSLSIAGCASVRAPAPSSDTGAGISAADLRRRLYLIADDSMMGRQSGSLGNYKTAEYVAGEFRRFGLEAAGENGSYFQTVPFWTAAVDPRSRLDVGDKTLLLGAEFLPATLAAPPGRLDGTATIYGGPANDSARWISAAQAAGKVVLLDLPTGASLRGLVIESARWRQSPALALVALDVVGPDQVARLRDGRPVADTARDPNTTPMFWLTRAAARKILGGDPSTLTPGADGIALRGHFDIARTPVPYPARNVVAILRGSDAMLRGQYVAITAHNDHVGYDHSPVDHDSIRAFNRVIRPMGADSPRRQPSADEWKAIRVILDSLRRANTPRLDSIRNGADDDGSGTVAILEIAQAMSRANVHPRRSILFVNHTGEEDGLIGSGWYTDHATVPMDSIAGEIDLDMIGRGLPSDFPVDGVGRGSPTYLEVAGAKRLSREFGDSLEAANAREPLPFVLDYRYDAPGHPLQQYCRADHYNYARYGIPSVSFSRGEHLDYHQVTDEAQYIDYPDLARVTHMVYAGALVIANMSHRPWLDGPKPADPHAPCRQ